MDAFLEYFLGSNVPKRLLRYAMARLDIFEDDALDLENLDAALGRRNTFEFKDVGLKVEVRLPASGPPAPGLISLLQV